MMLSFRGDVHKIFLKVKEAVNNSRSINSLNELHELIEIKNFYMELSVDELRNIRYRMLKEKGGMGIIPLMFGSLPWLGFIFSKKLQTLLFIEGKYIWLWFILLYSFTLTFGFWLHYREKAWATVHLEIIDDVIAHKMDEMEDEG